MGAKKRMKQTAFQKTKVLIIDLSKGFGGASVRALGLLSGLPAGTGALAALENSPVACEAVRRGLTVFTVGRGKLDPAIGKNIVRLIRSESFNVLDTQNIQSKLWGSLAACLTRTPLVSTLNSYYRMEHHNSPKGRIYQMLESMTRMYTARTIAVSNENKTCLTRDGNKETAVIPNAVDPAITCI